MKLVVGLGNVGLKYQNTRHNAGYVFADSLASNLGITFDEQAKLECLITPIYDSKLIIIKPTTFMNDSGDAVSLVSAMYKIKPEDIAIVHDDLDIPLGKFKYQIGRGPKLHYGLASIDEKLGTDQYWRLRLGVDGRGADGRVVGNAYVMADFLSEEKELVSTMINESVEFLKAKLLP